MLTSESNQIRTTITEDGDEIATINHATGAVNFEISGCDIEMLLFIGETAQRLVDEGLVEY